MQGCPCYDQLCLTGGAIGSGPPMSVGAAVAAPDRQVINLQADGSAMYTLQVTCPKQSPCQPASHTSDSYTAAVAWCQSAHIVQGLRSDCCALANKHPHKTGAVDAGTREAQGADHHLRQQHLRNPQGTVCVVVHVAIS